MHLNIFCNQNALYAQAINKRDLLYALGEEVHKLAVYDLWSCKPVCRAVMHDFVMRRKVEKLMPL